MARTSLKVIHHRRRCRRRGFSVFYAPTHGRSVRTTANIWRRDADCQAWGLRRRRSASKRSKRRAPSPRAQPQKPKQCSSASCASRIASRTPAGGFSPRPAFCLRRRAASPRKSVISNMNPTAAIAKRRRKCVSTESRGRSTPLGTSPKREVRDAARSAPLAPRLSALRADLEVRRVDDSSPAPVCQVDANWHDDTRVRQVARARR